MELFVAEAAPGWKSTPAGLVVPHRRRRYERPVGIDLFAGAGGFSLGMHQAGIHVAAAVEYDATAALTYLVNLGRHPSRGGVTMHYDGPEREAKFTRAVERHLGLRKPGKGARMSGSGLLAGEGWISSYGEPYDPADYPNEFLAEINEPPVHPDGAEHFWVADARKVKGADILDALELEPGEVDVVFGGPPCQGFSIANSKRTVEDPRNSLVFEFVRLVLEIRPKTMVMENVPQMLNTMTPDGVPVVDLICRVLADGGWANYNALHASLTSHPDARAAMAGDPRSRKELHHDPVEPEEDSQLDLFDAS